MTYPSSFKEKRQESRINSSLSVLVSIGTQLTLKGNLRDLSMTSAFVNIKESVFIETGDDITLSFNQSNVEVDDFIKVSAKVSRLVKGEGFAVYFTKVTDSAKEEIQKLCQHKS